MRTVQELETAGVAAASIKDTLLPRAYGETKPSLLSIEEGVGKMRAAVAAREDRSFVVVARTSAPSITGTADAIARAKAYQDTGVDALFFAGKITRDQLDEIAAVAKLPIVLGGLSPDMLDKPYLASRGVRVALQGHQPFSAAVQATYATLKALREGTKPSDLTGVSSAETMARVTREGDYKSWSERFLGG
jgi:carboxyvinyl-carboxyphosphonate phosphorylmutase